MEPIGNIDVENPERSATFLGAFPSQNASTPTPGTRAWPMTRAERGAAPKAEGGGMIM